jgi:hypothetical protein
LAKINVCRFNISEIFNVYVTAKHRFSFLFYAENVGMRGMRKGSALDPPKNFFRKTYVNRKRFTVASLLRKLRVLRIPKTKKIFLVLSSFKQRA